MTFYCKNVDTHKRYVWQTVDYVENSDPDIPAEYLANCPICNRPTGNVSDQYLKLYKAWNAQTGPRTPEGKARSALNHWKHGGYARKYHLLAPANPGKYPECEICEERQACESEPYKYCPVILGPMLRFAQAFREGDVKALQDFAGYNQLKAFQTVQMMFREVQQRGVLLPKVKKTEKDGTVITETAGYEANPVLSKILDYMTVLGHTADQQNITPRQKSEEEAISGYLKAEEVKVETLSEFMKLKEQKLLQLQEAVRRGNVAANLDPAVQRYKQESQKTDFEEVDDAD